MIFLPHCFYLSILTRYIWIPGPPKTFSFDIQGPSTIPTFFSTHRRKFCCCDRYGSGGELCDPNVNITFSSRSPIYGSIKASVGEWIKVGTICLMESILRYWICLIKFRFELIKATHFTVQLWSLLVADQLNCYIVETWLSFQLKLEMFSSQRPIELKKSTLGMTFTFHSSQLYLLGGSNTVYKNNNNYGTFDFFRQALDKKLSLRKVTNWIKVGSFQDSLFKKIAIKDSPKIHFKPKLREIMINAIRNQRNGRKFVLQSLQNAQFVRRHVL